MAIKVGEKYWFEYHCWESPESSDAELWYHSHQQCTIVSVEQEYPDMTEDERYDAAMLNHYNIRFSDGFVSSAGEDELYKNKKGFYRPNPPKINLDLSTE